MPMQGGASKEFHLSQEQTRNRDSSSVGEGSSINHLPLLGERFTSRMFIVPGSMRPIINLWELNKFIHWVHLKMEEIYLVQEGDWMVKIDLKDAYFAVPIDPPHRPFYAFMTYQFNCLPFRLSSVLGVNFHKDMLQPG